MRNTPNIVVVGHVCIDTNDSEHATYTGWGSTALYMAQYFQDVQVIRPTVITRYGKDFLPYAKDFTLHPSKPQEPKTQHNENVPHGATRIFRSFDVAYATAPELDAGAVKLIREADVVVLATLLPNYPPAFVQQVMELAKPSCLKVLALQGYLREVGKEGLAHPRKFVEADELLPLCDVSIFSEEDYPDAIGQALEWLHRHPKIRLIVTHGPQGATLVADGAQTHVPTTPILPEQIVDSVGCGDVFSAALAYSLWRQGNMLRAIRDAHHAAAKKLFAVTVKTAKKTGQ